jgi:hypothetical protein
MVLLGFVLAIITFVSTLNSAQGAKPSISSEGIKSTEAVFLVVSDPSMSEL